MNIFELISTSILFFLPAYIANAMPVIASGLKLTPFLAKPINAKFFGKTKTYRGFVYGILGALVVGLIRFYFEAYNTFHWEAELVFILKTSLLLGFGALFGDLVKSFIKRRIGKKSGESWAIFDQIDYVIGGLLFVSIVFIPPVEIIIILLMISPFFSLLANIIAYKLKLKKVWW